MRGCTTVGRSTSFVSKRKRERERRKEKREKRKREKKRERERLSKILSSCHIQRVFFLLLFLLNLLYSPPHSN